MCPVRVEEWIQGNEDICKVQTGNEIDDAVHEKEQRECKKEKKIHILSSGCHVVRNMPLIRQKAILTIKLRLVLIPLDHSPQHEQ